MASGARGSREGGRRGLLVIGGDGPSAETLRAAAVGAEVLAAADAGLVPALDAGLMPDLVVGDMDSLPDRALLDRVPPERVFVFPVDKDETDTEIGMRLLREKGCTEITIAGGGGGRIDHLFGVAQLFERPAPPVRWMTQNADMYLVVRAAEFAGWEGSTVSVFPLGARAAGMRSEGLRWPLDGLEFRRGFGGISNVVTAALMRITVGTGRLLVVRSRGGA
jgi:thiamine pyrophosphokinase